MVSITSQTNGATLAQPGWSLLVWWTVANAIGALIAILFAQSVTDGVYVSDSSYLDTHVLSIAATGVVFGSIIGLVEWMVMRFYIHGIGWWVLATSFGWGLAFIGEFYFLNMMYERSNLVTAPILGACIGIPQSLALWGRVRWAGIWVAGNILASLLLVSAGEPITEFVQRTLPLQAEVSFPIPIDLQLFVEIVLDIFVFEIITGVTLLILLRLLKYRS